MIPNPGVVRSVILTGYPKARKPGWTEQEPPNWKVYRSQRHLLLRLIVSKTVEDRMLPALKGGDIQSVTSTL